MHDAPAGSSVLAELQRQRFAGAAALKLSTRR